MQQTRRGIIYGVAAYLIWGAFPVFFTLIAPVGPFEIVPWRVLSTLAFCAILATVTRRWGTVIRILRTPRLLLAFTLSSLLLYGNWQTFVYAVTTGHVLETSLGYFINPLFVVIFAVVFWKERLSPLQWTAVAIAFVGVTISTIAYGKFPWLGIAVALTFALYGVVHQRIESVDGITGLTVETLVSAPVGIVQGVVVALTLGFGVFDHGAGMFTLVLLSGLVTALPLILFGEAARRLSLTSVGFLQFLTPILGFLYGYFVLHEEMSWGRWIGFIAVWIALCFLVVDMIRRVRGVAGSEPQLYTGPIPLD